MIPNRSRSNVAFTRSNFQSTKMESKVTPWITPIQPFDNNIESSLEGQNQQYHPRSALLLEVEDVREDFGQPFDIEANLYP